MEHHRHLVTLKSAVVIALMFSIFTTNMLNPHFFPEMWRLATSGDVDAIVAALRVYGMWAIAIRILLNVLINMLGLLPSIFFSTANGILFGVIPGIIISWVSECIGVIISFVLMKSLLRDHAEKVIGKSVYLQKIDEFSGENGFKMLVCPDAAIFTFGNCHCFECA